MERHERERKESRERHDQDRKESQERHSQDREESKERHEARIPVKARSNYDDSSSRKRDREYSAVCASRTENVECEEEYDHHGDSCQCDDCYHEWMATNRVDENDCDNANDYG